MKDDIHSKKLWHSVVFQQCWQIIKVMCNCEIHKFSDLNCFERATHQPLFLNMSK